MSRRGVRFRGGYLRISPIIEATMRRNIMSGFWRWWWGIDRFRGLNWWCPWLRRVFAFLGGKLSQSLVLIFIVPNPRKVSPRAMILTRAASSPPDVNENRSNLIFLPFNKF